jgi:hypothetical protein
VNWHMSGETVNWHMSGETVTCSSFRRALIVIYLFTYLFYLFVYLINYFIYLFIYLLPEGKKTTLESSAFLRDNTEVGLK